MQHAVQIAFDFDDQRVKDTVEKGCVDHINKELKQYVVDALFEKSFSSGYVRHGDPNRGFQDWVKDEVRDVLYENREYICQLAAKQIVESMNKNSKWKEKIVEEVRKGE